MARRLRAAGERAVAFADDNAIVDREVAHRAGLGWFGKNANLLLPGAGSWFVLGCVITTAAVPGAAEPGRRRLRVVPSVPRRLPDGRDRRAGRRRRQPLPGLGAATPGCHPGRAPSGGRRPPLRLRRLPGGVPADGPPRAPPPPAVARRRRGRGSTCSTCSPPTTTRCSTATAAGTSPAAIRGGCGATRSSSSATPPTRRDPRVAATLARYRHGDDEVLAEHARWASDAARAGRAGRRAAVVKHLLVTNDFPPKIGGIQSLLWEWWRRLPPDRFAVLTSPYDGAAQFDSAQPYRIERTPRAGAAAAPVDGAAHRPAGARGRRRPRRARPGDAARARRAVARAALRRRAARRRGHGAGPAAGHEAGARQRAAPGPPRRLGRRVRGRARPSGPPGSRCRSRSCRRASTSSGSGRSTTPSATRRGADFGLPVDAELVVSISRLVPAQGLRRGDRGRRPARARRARTSCWRSPAAAATSVVCAGWPPSGGRRCASSGAWRTTTCRRCTAAPTCSRWRAGRGGAGSSRRGSASSSSRPRRAACRRSPATPAARPRRSTTA